MSSDSESEEVEKIMKNQVANDTVNELGMIQSKDLNDDERQIIKGDTVGDTVYSGKWILGTLISLSKVHESGFNDVLERDLCMLWDMTTEKDIVAFLIEHEFLKIAEFVLTITHEPRLTEITVGIIGNMCCQITVLDVIATKKELVVVMFNLILSDDPETLIQVLRLLQSAVWDIQRYDESPWFDHLRECEFLGSALIFILKSSTNDDLLIATTDLLQSISTAELHENTNLISELFNVSDLIPALLESFTQLMPKQGVCHSMSELKVIENWLTILSNIMRLELLVFKNNENDENFVRIMNILLRILQPYAKLSNLMPIEERLALCIHESVDIILQFQQNEMQVMPEIIGIIVTILFRLKSAIITDSRNGFEKELDDIPEELLKYLERYWIETLGIYNDDKILNALRACEDNVVRYLVEMTESHPNASNDKIKKLKEIVSSK